MPLRRLALLFSLLLVFLLAAGYLVLRNTVVMPYLESEVLAAQRQELRNLNYQLKALENDVETLAIERARNDELVNLTRGISADPVFSVFDDDDQPLIEGVFLYDVLLQPVFGKFEPTLSLPMFWGEDVYRRARLMPLPHPREQRSRSGWVLQAGEGYVFASSSVCLSQVADCGHGYLLLLRPIGTDIVDRIAKSSGLDLSVRIAQDGDENLPELTEPESLRQPEATRALLVRDPLGQPALVFELRHLIQPPGFISNNEWVALLVLLLLVPLVNLLMVQLLVRPMEHGVAEIRAMQRNQKFRPLPNTAAIAEFRQLAEAFNNLMRLLSQQRDRLKQLSRTDTLTGLSNRRAMEQFLELEWRRLCRYKRGLAIMVLDVDHFKQFNDHYGHSTGDEVLLKVSRVLESMTRRGGELACRWGGDEFVVAITEPEEAGLVERIELIRSKLQGMAIAAPSKERSLTVSIGVAVAPPGENPQDKGMVMEDLVAQADRALFQAKEEGRNRWQIAREAS